MGHAIYMHLQPAAAVALCLVAVSVACAVPVGASPRAGARAQSDELGEVVQEMSDSIWIVFGDSRGRHWFGSDGQGVFRFDGKTLVRYTTADGLIHDHVRGIQEDAAGNIFISTSGGISKFDGRRFATLIPVKGDDSANEWKSEPGDLWFAGAENGPYRYDGQALHALAFPKIALEDVFRSKFPAVPYSPYAVFSVFRDSRGSMWFGTSNFGVCRYDGNSFAWITEDELTELDDGPMLGLRGIVEDRDGKFWFNYLQHRYDVDSPDSTARATGARWYRKEPGIVPPGVSGGPACFMSGLEDRHGVAWLASYGEGVWRYDGQHLTHFPVLVDGQPITLSSIHEDREGVLWLGTQANGAWRFNGKTFERFRP